MFFLKILGTKLGERIVPEGNEKLFDQAKQKQVNSKSKSLEKCLKAMTTDENCLAMFNGFNSITSN